MAESKACLDDDCGRCRSLTCDCGCHGGDEDLTFDPEDDEGVDEWT